MANRTPGNTIKDQVVAASANTAVNNTIMVAGKRGIPGQSDITTDLVPQFGFPKISLYIPVELEGFGSGSAALAWLSGCGFQVGYGSSAQIFLAAPTTATVASDSITWTLIFNGVPADFQPMIGISLSGSVIQATSTGSIRSATVNNDGNAQLVVVVADSSVTFTTSTMVQVNYTNTDISTPDPTKTEQVCMQLYDLFQELNTVTNQLQKPVTQFPKVYLCLFGSTDAAYSPNTASLALTTPAAVQVSGSAGTVYLGWTDTNQPSNWGLLPDTGVGHIVVTQTPASGDPVTGTFYAKGVGDPLGLGWNYYMVVSNVSGTFTAAVAYTIVKDGSQDLGTMTTAIASKYYLGHHALKAANAAKTQQFKTIIDLKNSQSVVSQNNGVGAFGYLADVNTMIADESTLTEYNDQYLIFTYFPQPINVLSSVNLDDVNATDAAAFVLACNAMNGKPFNPTNNIISSTLVAPTSNLYRITKGLQGDSEIILNRGYTPLYVNAFNQVATVRVVTTQLTLPGTTVSDTEFFPATTQQILMAFNEDILTGLAAPQFQNQRKTDTVKNSIWSFVYNMAVKYQTDGMFANVADSKSLFAVIDNPEQADSWIVNIPCKIIPELNNLYINVNIYSFLVPF